MNRKLIWAIGVVVVGVGIAFFALTKNGKGTTSTNLNNNTSTSISSYSLSQVSEHSNTSSCWIIISGKVYDVTNYIPMHPNTQILDGCGKDATDMFNSVGKHIGRATDMLPDYLIGTLSN